MLYKSTFLNISEHTKCSAPGGVRDGSVVGDNYTVGSSITYHCDEGYVLLGTDTRTCGTDAQWTGTAPLCHKGDLPQNV